MKTLAPQGKNVLKGIRLAARITGGIWLGLGLITLLFAIGEGIQSNQSNLNEPKDIGIFIIISCVAGLAGIVLAYWKEGPGGLISFLRIFIAGSPAVNRYKNRFQHYFFIIAILPWIYLLIGGIKESIQIISSR